MSAFPVPSRGRASASKRNSPDQCNGVRCIGIAAHAAHLRGIGLENNICGPFTSIAHRFGERFGGKPAIAFELVTR